MKRDALCTLAFLIKKWPPILQGNIYSFTLVSRRRLPRLVPLLLSGTRPSIPRSTPILPDLTEPPCPPTHHCRRYGGNTRTRTSGHYRRKKKKDGRDLLPTRPLPPPPHLLSPSCVTLPHNTYTTSKTKRMFLHAHIHTDTHIQHEPKQGRMGSCGASKANCNCTTAASMTDASPRRAEERAGQSVLGNLKGGVWW